MQHFLLFIGLSFFLVLSEGCTVFSTSDSDSNYYEILIFDEKGISTQKFKVENHLSDWYLPQLALNLKKINNEYLAVGVHNEILIVDIKELEILNKKSFDDEKDQYNWISPWYRVESKKEPIEYGELTSLPLIHESILEGIDFSDPLNPTFQKIFKSTSERLNTNRHKVPEIINIISQSSAPEIVSKVSTYDLVTDSLQTRLFVNLFTEGFNIYKEDKDGEFISSIKFIPSLPLRNLNYKDCLGLINNRYAFFIDYSWNLYVQDLQENLTELVRERLPFQHLDNHIIVGDKIVFTATNSIFSYDPSKKELEPLTDSIPHLNEVVLAFDEKTENLYIKYIESIVNGYVNAGKRINLLRVNLKNFQSENLYSTEHSSQLPYSNIIKINGVFYTVASYKN